jgi:diguanylate cyclase (GGDEF)-like protein/PAS domain S-box-containing protein
VSENRLAAVEAIPGCREVVSLTASFNRMVNHLRRGREARDKAEKALRLAEQEAVARAEEAEAGKRILDALMEHIPLGVAIADSRTGTGVYMSRYGHDMICANALSHDCIREVACGERILLFHKDTGVPAEVHEMPIYRAAMNGEICENEEWIFNCGDGRRPCILCNAGPIRNSSGEIIAGVVAWSDITKLKRAEGDLKDSLVRHQTLLETARDGVHVVDQQGNLTQYSDSFLAMLGYSKAEAATLNVRDWEADIASDNLAAFIKGLIRNEATFETRHRRKDGTIMDVEISAKGLDLNGDLYLYASSRDLTPRKQAERALRESDARFRTIVETVNEGVWTSDASFRITFVNRVMAEILQNPPDAILGKSLSDFVDPEHRGLLVGQREQRRGGKSGRYEIGLRNWHGNHVWGIVSATPLIDEEGNFSGSIGLFSDISERKRLEDELKRLASTDPLTGITNRRKLLEQSADAFLRSRRYGAPLTFAMIDIDKFKDVNDRFGHDVGDDVLKMMSTACMNCLRATDVFGRLGGEEFGGLLVQTGPDGARELAERIRHTLETLVLETEHGQVRFTVSIGLSSYKDGDASVEDIIKRSDNALYAAKRSGRNCVCFA